MFLTISDNGKGIEDTDTGRVYKNIDALKAAIRLNGGAAACSSSLDFPREYTKNRNVIAMCSALRG